MLTTEYWFVTMLDDTLCNKQNAGLFIYWSISLKHFFRYQNWEKKPLQYNYFHVKSSIHWYIPFYKLFRDCFRFFVFFFDSSQVFGMNPFLHFYGIWREKKKSGNFVNTENPNTNNCEVMLIFWVTEGEKMCDDLSATLLAM